MNPPNWQIVKEFEDITYKKCDGVARIAFNRPDVRNAFQTANYQRIVRSFL